MPFGKLAECGVPTVAVIEQDSETVTAVVVTTESSAWAEGMGEDKTRPEIVVNEINERTIMYNIRSFSNVFDDFDDFVICTTLPQN